MPIDQLHRRDFIKATAVMATACPLAARAQHSTANVPIVTFINGRRAGGFSDALAAEFRKGLSQTGVIEGKDAVIEYHWLDGHYEDIPGSSMRPSDAMSLS